ncbi:MAG: isoprenylcysteine carboxylmethyltransferase family protein [Clostridiales bacterium]|jgi:protein-S-isoprenylcysteine O-methyltransferase Ste14|nr:isoprenylcysteine carboxylmethyltransferase family protein [Clostridiales bacterium]
MNSDTKPKRFLLLLRMITQFGLGFALIGVLLFLSAGSFDFLNGWILIITLALPMVIFGFALFIKDPAVLSRRMRAKEPDKTQRAVVGISALMFISSFILSGLNYRFSWPGVPFAVSIAAVVIMLTGYIMFAAVILQNSYAARTVEVQENQKVISTGLYALVRHPMYTATLLLYIAMPFVLGSWIGFLPVAIYPFIIVRRIKNEEEMLRRELDGYKEYTEKVKYRLLPYVW